MKISFAEFAINIANQRNINFSAVRHFFTNVTLQYNYAGIMIGYNANDTNTLHVPTLMLDWSKMANAFGPGGGKITPADREYYQNQYSNPGVYNWNDSFFDYTVVVTNVSKSFNSSLIRPLPFFQITMLKSCHSICISALYSKS